MSARQPVTRVQVGLIVALAKSLHIGAFDDASALTEVAYERDFPLALRKTWSLLARRAAEHRVVNDSEMELLRQKLRDPDPLALEHPESAAALVHLDATLREFRLVADEAARAIDVPAHRRRLVKKLVHLDATLTATEVA